MVLLDNGLLEEICQNRKLGWERFNLALEKLFIL